MFAIWIWSFSGPQWELLVLPVIVLSNKVIIIIIIIIIIISLIAQQNKTAVAWRVAIAKHTYPNEKVHFTIYLKQPTQYLVTTN